MTALQGALALPEVARRPGAVADDLDLDVARTPNQLFQIDRVIAEAELGLGTAACVRLLELVDALDDAHAAAATASGGLHHDGATVGKGLEEGGSRLQRLGDPAAAKRRD